MVHPNGNIVELFQLPCGVNFLHCCISFSVLRKCLYQFIIPSQNLRFWQKIRFSKMNPLSGYRLCRIELSKKAAKLIFLKIQLSKNMCFCSTKIFVSFLQKYLLQFSRNVCFSSTEMFSSVLQKCLLQFYKNVFFSLQK